MGLFGKSAGRGGSWLSGVLGTREIQRRVDENFPTWEEFADQQAVTRPDAEAEADRFELPPHRVYVSSPLHGNFLYLFLTLVALALGFYSPALAPVLVYAAIAVSLAIALVLVFRDAVFYHLEGLRLEADSALINRHTRGPQDGSEDRGLGFLKALSRKQSKRKVFRSSLLQIHYQNVLRTFEQGNRRTWVSQDASVAELHTLLTQRGMKVVWTLIEVLPQLGLLGTLIGLMRMFLAFRADVAAPELEVLSGFATALGTTVMANVFVLILRPLYMRNERSMHEILSTIQTLMAMFILPTQQSVLERNTALGALGSLCMSQSGFSSAPAPSIAGPHETRLYQTLEDLSRGLGEFIAVQQQVDSGTMARETAEIAKDVKETLKSFQDATDRAQVERQQHAVEQLTQAVEGLAGKLGRMESAAGAGSEGNTGATQRMERDLTQLRVLTHDTLLLLEQIASRLDPIPARRGKLLTTDKGVRGQVFGKGDEGLTTLEDDRDPTPTPSRGIRLFK